MKLTKKVKTKVADVKVQVSKHKKLVIGCAVAGAGIAGLAIYKFKHKDDDVIGTWYLDDDGNTVYALDESKGNFVLEGELEEPDKEIENESEEETEEVEA